MSNAAINAAEFHREKFRGRLEYRAGFDTNPALRKVEDAAVDRAGAQPAVTKPPRLRRQNPLGGAQFRPSAFAGTGLGLRFSTVMGPPRVV